jgi:glycosyltransferase involved in cell wall biosynthesis
MTPSGFPRIVHCVGFYFPENVGGTEVYVRDLACALRARSIESVIVAATNGGYQEYDWEGTKIFRYPSSWVEFDGDGGRGLSRFGELLSRLKPDIFHLHSWTPGAGLAHLVQAAGLDIRSVVTLHLVSSICMRGTMLLNGKTPCDGRIEETRCSHCWVLQRGAPEAVAFAVSRLPKIDATEWNVTGLRRRIGTLLSIRSLVASKARELQTMARLASRLVAPSDWVRAALLRNGVPPQSIVVSRQAASPVFTDRLLPRPARPPAAPLRIGYVGRLESFKGITTLIDALESIQDDVRLLIAGTGIDPEYLQSLKGSAERDRRIHLIGPVNQDELPKFLSSVDVIAVPSQILETGPLVVHEAHAAGVPVLGADLGGITERIRHGVDGLLLPFDDPQAWVHAIHELARNRPLLARLAANCSQARTSDDVASEMAALYRQILDREPDSRDRTGNTAA